MTKTIIRPFMMRLRGKIVNAEYNYSPIVDYRDNPIIEALPPIFSKEEAITKLVKYPIILPEEKELPVHHRLHCVQRIADFVQPLSVHLDLEQRFSRLIRYGYIARNPLTPEYKRRIRCTSKMALEKIPPGPIEGMPRSTAAGFDIIGISGVGKTTAVDRILSAYPQVINHGKYKGENLALPQVVWLHLDCPHDGSIRGLCLNFFQAIDSLILTSYYEKYQRYTVDQLIPHMAHIASLFCLGVLVIDEIQNLHEAKSGGSEKMMNFFVQLVNTIGVPVVLIGTFKAFSLLGGSFREARRGTGQGDLVWERLDKDGDWDVLVESLWDYQWTSQYTELTEEINNTLYEESQGVTDVLVKLFMLAQWRALTTGRERITPGLIKSVAKDSLKLLRPFLNALKNNDKVKLAMYDDVCLPEEYLESYRKQSLCQAEAKGLLLKNKQQQQGMEVVLISKISLWLVEAGVEMRLAQQCATKVVEANPGKEDIAALRKLAYSQAMGISDDGKEKNKLSIKRKTIDLSGDDKDLRLVMKRGSKEGKPGFEALLDAGNIRDSEEFLA